MRLAIACLLAATTAAHAKRAFTLEDFYKLRNISGLQVAGKTVVYTVVTSDLPHAKRQTHLWMTTTDGADPRQLTTGDASETSPVIAPDGKQVAFIRGDQLWVMPLDGGEARKVSDVATGVRDPLWAPDGKSIAVASDVFPECGADDACNKKRLDQQNGPLKVHVADTLLYRHWDSWKDGKREHVLLVDVAKGAARDLTPGDFDAPRFEVAGPIGYDLSPDGSELAYVSDHDKDQATSTNGDIWVVSLRDGGGKPKNLTESNKAFDGTPRYSPDGKWIAYRRQAKPGYESDKFELWLYDRKAHTSKALTASFDNWVEDFEWARDSSALVFEAPVDGVTPLYKVTLDGTVTKLFEGKSITLFALAGESPVVVMNAVDKPPEIYLGGKPLTHLNDALAAEVDLRGAEATMVGNVQVFIVKPHDFDPKKKYPLILNVHGGPQYMWSDAFRGEYQIFPGAGYVMAFANPHGSTGYGQAFTSEISGDFGGQVYDDLMAVTDALEKLPYVDKTKMGAMGWSYGGYMMAWFEGHTDRFKALVSMMGIYDLKAFWGSTEELWFPEWDLHGTPLTSADYDKFSPSTYAKNFKSPMLVISGEHDYRIPYTQSLELFTALQRQNVPSKLIVYENASHWPGWYEMALYYTAHLEWFHKYLGGAAGPWTTEQFARNAVFDTKTGEKLKGR